MYRLQLIDSIQKAIQLYSKQLNILATPKDIIRLKTYVTQLTLHTEERLSQDELAEFLIILCKRKTIQHHAISAFDWLEQQIKMSKEAKTTLKHYLQVSDEKPNIKHMVRLWDYCKEHDSSAINQLISELNATLNLVNTSYYVDFLAQNPNFAPYVRQITQSIKDRIGFVEVSRDKKERNTYAILKQKDCIVKEFIDWAIAKKVTIDELKDLIGYFSYNYVVVENIPYDKRFLDDLPNPYSGTFIGYQNHSIDKNITIFYDDKLTGKGFYPYEACWTDERLFGTVTEFFDKSMNHDVWQIKNAIPSIGSSTPFNHALRKNKYLVISDTLPSQRLKQQPFLTSPKKPEYVNTLEILNRFGPKDDLSSILNQALDFIAYDKKRRALNLLQRTFINEIVEPMKQGDKKDYIKNALLELSFQNKEDDAIIKYLVTSLHSAITKHGFNEFTLLEDIFFDKYFTNHYLNEINFNVDLYMAIGAYILKMDLLLFAFSQRTPSFHYERVNDEFHKIWTHKMKNYPLMKSDLYELFDALESSKTPEHGLFLVRAQKHAVRINNFLLGPIKYCCNASLLQEDSELQSIILKEIANRTDAEIDKHLKRISDKLPREYLGKKQIAHELKRLLGQIEDKPYEPELSFQHDNLKEFKYGITKPGYATGFFHFEKPSDQPVQAKENNMKYLS